MKEKVILVPTDFSSNSEAAVKYAVRLAEDTSSQLVFLHAFRLLQTIPSIEKSPLIIKEEWDTDTADKFCKLQESLLADTSVKYECVTDIGFADDSIQSCAKNFGASIIIIGASGERRWAGVYGSTTISVINNSTIPVIVIPADTTYVKVCDIAFAYDFKPIKYKNQLQSAVNFFGTPDSTFEVLNISESGVTGRHKEMVEPFLPNLDINYQIIQDNDVVRGILKFMEGSNTDLLIVLKRHHSLLEQAFTFSISNKIVLKSKLPIMIIRE